MKLLRNYRVVYASKEYLQNTAFEERLLSVEDCKEYIKLSVSLLRNRRFFEMFSKQNFDKT